MKCFCGESMVLKQASNGLYHWRCNKCGKYLPDTRKSSPNRKIYTKVISVESNKEK